MNKTQIRNALNLKRDAKILEIKNHANNAENQLLQNEVSVNFSETLKEINSLLYAINNKTKLNSLIENLIEQVSNNKEFDLDGHYYMKKFISYINNGFEDEISLSWKNEKLRKIEEDKKQLIKKVESEYEKLGSVLVKMTANEFYNYLLSIGVNLEIKETEKQQLPATIIDTSYL